MNHTYYVTLYEASVNHLSEVLRYYYNGNFYNKVDSKKEPKLATIKI